MNKSSYGIEFLPRGKEGLLDFIQFGSEVVHEFLEISNIWNETDGDTKVSIVVFAFEGRGQLALDEELVQLDAWCMFIHG